QANSVQINIQDGLTLNGTATLGSNSSFGFLDFVNNETLGGTGSIIFNGPKGANALLVNTFGVTLTIGPGITIHGQTGYVGWDPNFGGDSEVAVINQGTIAADMAGGTIVLRADSGWSNQGPLQALNGGTLTLPTTWSNSGGISVGAGSTLALQGSGTM